MWDLIVSVPDHCLSFYFTFRFWLLTFLLTFLAVLSVNALRTLVPESTLEGKYFFLQFSLECTPCLVNRAVLGFMDEVFMVCP